MTQKLKTQKSDSTITENNIKNKKEASFKNLPT